MRTSVVALSALSGLTLALVSIARANPVPDPIYTFCETEDNDLCSIAQILDANLAAASVGGGAEGEFLRDCFYLTGKLQEDCVWDVEPKCAMKVYDKPAPCRTTSGAVIPGSFYEPIVRSSNGEDLTNVIPLSDHTIRLGVAALQDAFDGTINGLANNGRHNEIGEVTIKVFYNGGGDGQPRGDQPDQSYVFRFGGPKELAAAHTQLRIDAPEPVCYEISGSDALRVAFIIPSNVSSVDILCCNNTGQQALCYDVDHYKVTNLLASRAYSIEVIGGIDDDSAPGCDCAYATDTIVGIFDKNCNLVDFNDDKSENDCRVIACRPDAEYSKIYAFAEVDGSLRFAVTGRRDTDFNGLNDDSQFYYFDFLDRLRIIDNLNYDYRQGASLKDASAGDVNRYPRFIWDVPSNQNPYGEDFYTRFGGAPEAGVSHGVCGGYCIKIQLAEHIDPNDRPIPPFAMNGARADINSDGVVNASDLALLLSYWGIVQ